MSVILESKEFYVKLNHQIKKLLANGENKYLIYNLNVFCPEKVQERIANNIDIFNDWIDNEINDLYNFNVVSYNERYKEDETKEIIENFIKVELYNFKLSQKELIQLYQNLNFINYQIECKYNDNFLKFIQWCISRVYFQNEIEIINGKYSTLKEQYKYGIHWGEW